MSYTWNWHFFLTPIPYEETTYLEWLVSGLGMTVLVSLSAWAIALTMGTLAGVARTLPNPWLRSIARGYVEIFRNIPLLVQLFLWYYVMPELLPTEWGDAYKETDPITQQFAVAVIGLGLFTSARLAEHIRAGLGSLPIGQKHAALALGLSLPQIYLYILLPMAFRMMIPTLTSELLNTFKNSAVCATLGLVELSYQAGELAECQNICVPYESFIFITLAYLSLNLIAMTVMRWMERKARIPGYIGVQS